MQNATKPLYNSEEAIEAFKKEYPKGVDLCYVDYSDELTDEQCNTIIQGKDIDLWDESWIWDTENESIHNIVTEISNITDFEYSDMNDDDLLYDVIREADTSNVVKDLTRNTRNKFMYYDLECGIMAPDSQEAIEANVHEIATKLGINEEKHREQLTELTANASYGGSLCFIWYGSIQDVKPGNYGEDDTFIKFDNAHLCIMDRMNGSGHDIKLEEIIYVDLKRGNLWLDSEASGYSYNEVCGLYLPAYDAGVVTTKTMRNYVRLEPTEGLTEEEERVEQEKQWDNELKTNKICNSNDPRYASHTWEYINEPMNCRNQCSVCGRIIMD